MSDLADLSAMALAAMSTRARAFPSRSRHRFTLGVTHICLPNATYQGSHSSHRADCAAMPIFSMRMLGVADGLNTTTATG
eukprot:3485567-Prymnesium_polylepis.1